VKKHQREAILISFLNEKGLTKTLFLVVGGLFYDPKTDL
jgi:hypothetical protein